MVDAKVIVVVFPADGTIRTQSSSIRDNRCRAIANVVENVPIEVIAFAILPHFGINTKGGG